jgi:hypothetical protein
MPYTLLIVEDPKQRGTRTLEEGEEVYDRMVKFSERLKNQGLLLATQSLMSNDSAARLQVRDGKTSIMDGPFTEAKEMIGGFFLLDCSTREQALAIAAQCPAAQWATVEIREAGPCFM